MSWYQSSEESEYETNSLQPCHRKHLAAGGKLCIFRDNESIQWLLKYFRLDQRGGRSHRASPLAWPFLLEIRPVQLHHSVKPTRPPTPKNAFPTLCNICQLSSFNIEKTEMNGRPPTPTSWLSGNGESNTSLPHQFLLRLIRSLIEPAFSRYLTSQFPALMSSLFSQGNILVHNSETQPR